MNRSELRALLVGMNLTPRFAEEPLRGRMLGLLDAPADCFERTSYAGHFTGSALVVSADGKSVLLHHHRKLDRWMQFGGHCEDDANILEVAHREALEESGIEGLKAVQETPFDLDIHEIPARPATSEPAHFHYDIRFLFIAEPTAPPEGIRWVSLVEVAGLPDASLSRMARKARATP